MFGLCQFTSLPERAAKVLAWLSKASFCVFLTRIVFLKPLMHMVITVLRGPAVLTVPLLAAALLAGR